MTGATIPRATYRLQLHKGFRFADAQKLGPYLAGLGITHAYLSPIFKARPGSTHGYDTIDHGEINPELGTLDEFRELARAFRRHGLGIVLDIVPNHMGVGGADNRFWLDVLEHGEASRYAAWFDIDWRSPAPGVYGKLLLPFLRQSFGEALQDGSLQLASDGGLAVWVDNYHKLPLSPETAAGIGADEIARINGDPAALVALIDRQHWRIATAKVGDDEINYRRFFTVSDLAGIRVERDDVFAYVHALPFQLIEEGLVDGFRIDHVDGLYDPADYCRRLRDAAPRPIYLIVEKILAAEEMLPESWGVDGATGYEFASLVTPLLVDPEGAAALARFHDELTGITRSAADFEWQAKLEILDGALAAELEALSWRFARLALGGIATRDLTRRKLKHALRAFVAAMPVYRCYVDGAGASEDDKSVAAAALNMAKQRQPDLDPDALAFIAGVLAGRRGDAAAVDVAMRTQQFTTAVMAKGLEDTALYRDNRLIALNDVGERPGPSALPIAQFHATQSARSAAFPHALLGTSTHDSKRGEDTRCRIVALSGCADAWIANVPIWLSLLRRLGAPAIPDDDAYHFFQLLLGAWVGPPSPDFVRRMTEAMRKSMREARLRTNWTQPDAAYEQRLGDFIDLALDSHRGRAFLDAFAAFEAQIGRWGAFNGLIETTLKLTIPGVPDFYQGAERWEQSMVDPDNRRPVDFTLRMKFADGEAEGPLDDMLAHWGDGAIKQALITRLLACRAAQPELFAAGAYVRLDAPDNCYAFLRSTPDATLLVMVQLYPWRGAPAASCRLPPDLEAFGWTDILAGGPLDLASGAAMTGRLPIFVALRSERLQR